MEIHTFVHFNYAVLDPFYQVATPQFAPTCGASDERVPLLPYGTAYYDKARRKSVESAEESITVVKCPRAPQTGCFGQERLFCPTEDDQPMCCCANAALEPPPELP